MPIYQYVCAVCNSESEYIRPVSKADEPADCKNCGGNTTRVLTMFSFKSDTFTAPKLRSINSTPMREKPNNLD
jgi:putative FmdB family regulatory protein